MILPGSDNAVVDVAKLRDYCLNHLHPRGRHKARVFVSRLGLVQSDADFLRNELLRVAREGEAMEGESDEYGDRYTIDFVLAHRDRWGTIRSSWIVRHGEQVPRLTSCYVLLD